MRLSLCPIAAVRSLLLIAAILIGSLTMAARVDASAGAATTTTSAMADEHCAMQADDHGERRQSPDHRDMPAQHCALACALVLPLVPQPALRSKQSAASRGGIEPAPLAGVIMRLHLPPPRA